jgi:hypothetical protein
MGALTNLAENKIQDAVWRGQALGAPATHYFALIAASRGYSSAVRSAVVSIGDTLLPTTPNGRMYRCTTGGTCGAGEPTWSTVNGGTTADGGTVVWTEMTPDFEAGTNLTEVSGGGYARQPLAASLANFAGTQALLSTTASTGTGGQTANNVAITYGTPSANWGVIGALVTASSLAGALSTDAWSYQTLTTPKTVNNGDSAPSFAISAFTNTLD